MLDYPLRIPYHTLYDDLGLDPAAAPDEISDAIGQRVAEIQAEIKQIERQLQEVYQKVTGLKEAEERVQHLRFQNADKSADLDKQRREAHDTLDKLELKALTANPEYKHLRKRHAELSNKENDLNQLPLSDPAKRNEYDAEHPPLELYNKLADCKRWELFNRTSAHVTLTVLRDELSRFLTAQGEEVFHPNDLTRTDFSDDFTYVPLLDRDPK